MFRPEVRDRTLLDDPQKGFEKAQTQLKKTGGHLVGVEPFVM